MPRKSRKNVGLIGLGIIGSRVAQGLRASGFQVFVWNRTPKPAPNFLGSPAEVAEICDVIQLFVADSQALFDVIDALSETLNENHIVICNATVGPEATLEAAKLVQARGARFLDAPFTGSRGAAEKRQLVYYVGGDEATIKKAEPVLKACSKSIVRCGEIGHAAVLKVVTNMITGVTTQTLAEALAIVRKSGLKTEVFAAALESNASRSGTLDMKLPKMVSGDYEPHFSLKHMFKDVQLAIHVANSLELEIPATTVTAGVMYGALNNGWDDLDFASVFKLYDTALAGVRPEVLDAEKAAAAPAQIEAPKNDSPSSQALATTSAGGASEAETSDAKPPAAEDLKSVNDGKTMEVVADVPKNAKQTSETGGAAADQKPAKSDGENSDGDAGKKRQPLNRIKRFFSSPSSR